MKKQLSILAIAAAGLFSSCEKFMDRQPQSQIAPDQYFNNDNELRFYLNSFYSAFPSAEGVYNEDIDNVVKQSLGDNITGRRTVPLTGGNWTWTELRKINFFLDNYNRVMPESQAGRYAGVAKFFRAYFYFDKVQRFGDVPWYSSAILQTDKAMLTKARDPRNLVVDSIVKDLEYAIEKIDDLTYPGISGPTTELVTKYTAMALLSRVCLFEGTWRKYRGETGWEALLTKGAAAAEQLMSSGKYKIYTSTPEKAYLELFASIAPIKDEIILAKNFSNELSVWHNVNYYTITSSYGKPGLDKQLVNSYLMADGSRFTDIPRYDTITFYAETQNRDPRLSQTIRTPGYARIGTTNPLVPDFGASVTGYQLIKFVTDMSFDSYNRSINSMPIFRYAEVLLNFAEAKAELGTLTQADIDKSIKLLRDRVGMPNLDLAAANASADPYMAAQYPGVTGANRGVILEIRRERRIELVMESYRWNDLMRWKSGQSLVRQFKGMYFPGVGQYDLDRNGKTDVYIYEGTKPTPVAGVQYFKLGSEIDLENGAAGGNVIINRSTTKTFNEDRDYLQPVPIQERQLNTNLSQNPNWVDGL
ncbi:RagB/SusD family nutrient uptake outer membrane protein [Chitinophaga sp. GCM10012297]|uniref:RagB/SusD family nutrient uptake outer membrane protein n=1 Tax=Chitinophaga chungangae TaxID=2821488 RepID=A0ABS3YGT9_9BACT|nr:RagB/SusD family nutrient uptake outer membrane protein [Chitinophaga chungangae]MBO9153900.1 RagB/SusD family nutrient uptake outer membrane protein [Chitinophaga chungangae]